MDDFLKLNGLDMFSFASKKLIKKEWTPAQHKIAIERWLEANGTVSGATETTQQGFWQESL